MEISSSSEDNLNRKFTTQKPTSQISFTNLLKHESQVIYSCFSSLFSADSTHEIIRKVAAGLLGAAYVCFLLFVVMIVAVVLGVGLVGFWVEEPVFVRENLLFDYSQVNPSAVFALGEFRVGLDEKDLEVLVGQTYYVDLVLVMPESDYNIDIGMFQVHGVDLH